MVKRFRRKFTIAVLAFICVGALAVAARFWYLEEQGNFHAITPGQAYRSAQLDTDELEYYIRKAGIRSIINLRGKSDTEQWYADEMAVSRKLGVRHYSIGLSATETPTFWKIKKLIALFHQAPRPVLIHCKAGADRSGLAAALWKMAVNGASKSVARKQLSLRYGHLPIGPTRVLDSFLENWDLSRAKGDFHGQRVLSSIGITARK